jgi:hypothetical protein
MTTTIRDHVHARCGAHVRIADDLDLLRTLVQNIGRGREPAPRWVHVRDCIGHGSTVSHAICRALGVDPDEEVGTEREAVECERCEYEACIASGAGEPPDCPVVGAHVDGCRKADALGIALARVTPEDRRLAEHLAALPEPVYVTPPRPLKLDELYDEVSDHDLDPDMGDR